MEEAGSKTPISRIRYSNWIGSISRRVLILAEPVQEILRTLSAARAPKKDGKGNPYVDILSHHMPMLDALQTNARKVFRKAFCG